VFTDFACPECHRKLPSLLAAIRRSGKTPRPIPVAVVGKDAPGMLAGVYARISEYRGFGTKAYLASPDPNALAEFEKVLKIE
ncbi:MAG: hypothetical protein C4320_05030, partial [Armatimonadota bacterium]